MRTSTPPPSTGRCRFGAARRVPAARGTAMGIGAQKSRVVAVFICATGQRVGSQRPQGLPARPCVRALRGLLEATWRPSSGGRKSPLPRARRLAAAERLAMPLKGERMQRTALEASERNGSSRTFSPDQRNTSRLRNRWLRRAGPPICFLFHGPQRYEEGMMPGAPP